jgi:hypothetical protein
MVLKLDVLKDKMKGCWVGKNILTSPAADCASTAVTAEE